MSHTFLFELGTEEIPAWMIEDACASLSEGVVELLAENSLEHGRPALYNSPRRLALLLPGLASKQPDLQETVTGPPRSVAFDAEGKPTPAAQGFARKWGLSVPDLQTVETDRGPYVGFRRTVAGRDAKDVLAEVVPQAVRRLSWPKNMYWLASRFRFIRPIRWLVALWDAEVLDFEIEGIRTGRVTRGHRFLGKPRIEVPSPGDYLDLLRHNGVMADVQQRRRRIVDGIHKAMPAGLSFHEDPDLLDAVVYLNEWPSVIRGDFDPRFLEISREVLITVMRFHQKYFWIKDGEGRIQPHFLTVLNTEGDPDGLIRGGHEKVLRARLEDAAFFWNNDLRVPLQERLPGLEKILFQDRLGSYGDKTRRIQDLCVALTAEWDSGQRGHLLRAAQLCKADLTTEMVGELSELQGVMGGLYARHQGEPEAVATAVYEHYQPVAFEDAVPKTACGAMLSLVDRLDTLAGAFGIGMAPTGSRDPFGLRRQAQGLVKILFEKEDSLDLALSLPQCVDAAVGLHSAERSRDQVQAEVLDFLSRRVRYSLEQEGLAYDVLNAVLAVGIDRVRQTRARASALAEIRSEEDFAALAFAFKRIRNILAKQNEELGDLDEGLLQENAERRLHEAFRRLAPQIENRLGEDRFVDALRLMAQFRRPADAFFDEVMVMVDDGRLRRNRLRLLRDLESLFLRVADISEIVQKETGA